MRGPLDTDSKANQVVAHLEKNVGKGNFDLTYTLDEDFNDEMLDDDVDFEEEVLVDYYERFTTDEKLELFTKLVSDEEKLTPDERARLVDLSESIIDDALDLEKMDELYHVFTNRLEDIKIVSEIPDEVLQIDKQHEQNAMELKSQFAEIYDLIDTDEPSLRKKIKKLHKEQPVNPAICFLELSWLRAEDFTKYQLKLKQYADEFPDYPLIRLLKQIGKLNYDENYTGQDIPFENAIKLVFPGRKVLHHIEILHLLMFLIFRAQKTGNMEQAIAIENVIEEVGFAEPDIHLLRHFITYAKLIFVLSMA